MKKSILFLLIVFSQSSFAQLFPKSKLDSFFNTLEKRGLAMGSLTIEQLQITINCTKDGNILLLETRGKIFDAEPVNRNYFMHTPTGYFFEFFPEKNELLVKETDNIYYLKRIK